MPKKYTQFVTRKVSLKMFCCSTKCENVKNTYTNITKYIKVEVNSLFTFLTAKFVK